MSTAPSPNNYTLGRGKLRFDKKNSATGLYEGERDLGNAPAVSLSVALEKLDHFNSRSGLRAKDKSIISQVTPTINFTLDEVNSDNIKMMFMGSAMSVSQTASDGFATALSGVNKERYYDIGNKSIVGCTYLQYDTGATAFSVGETVTGGTSAATADVEAVIGDATEGILLLSNVTGNFQAAETITSAGGSASATAQEVVLTDDVVVTNTAGTTIYTLNTDYTLELTRGCIFITAAGAITDGSDIVVGAACGALTYSVISGFAEESIEGRLRFISDNPVGDNREFQIWRVDLTPAGELALIGDEFMSIPFNGEILKDETNHPAMPYMEIVTM